MITNILQVFTILYMLSYTVSEAELVKAALP